MGTRLFLGRLARGTNERDIEKLLRGYGEIRDIALMDRYGFVELRNPKDASDALHDLNGKNFRGERIIVEYARSRGASRGGSRSDRRDTRGSGPPRRTNNRLIVENVSSRANWQDLKDFMRKAGEVSFADCHKERFGEGIVEFENYDDLKYALEKLQDAEFSGKRIHLIDDSSNGGSRRRSRSRSFSRSPRRNRSRSRTSSPRRSSRRDRSRSPRRSSRRSISPRRDRSRERGRRARSRSHSPGRKFEEGEADYHSPVQSRRRSQRSQSRSRSRSPYRSRSRSPANDANGDVSPNRRHDDAPYDSYDAKENGYDSGKDRADNVHSDEDDVKRTDNVYADDGLDIYRSDVENLPARDHQED